MAYKFQLGDAVMSGALEQEQGLSVTDGALSGAKRTISNAKPLFLF